MESQMADAGNIPTTNEIIHAADIVNNYATKAEVNKIVTDIDAVLDKINGEVV